MHPQSPPQTAPKQAPSKAALQQQHAALGPKGATGHTKPKVLASKLTPEEQAKKDAEDAETKRQEQVKIVAINDAWKAKLTDDEEAEVLDMADRNGKDLVVDGVIQPCLKRKKPANLDCVPGKQSLNTGLSKELAAAVTKAQEEKRQAKNTKIKIDYAKVCGWEGGSFTGGYIPWGPTLEAAQKDIGEKDKPHNVTIFVPGTAHNTATGQTKTSLTGRPNNNSGVTIGAGVDFGSKTDAVQRKAIKKSAKESGLLTDAEADQLADKVKPYYGLKRTEACSYLRKHPLNLSQNEVDVLNYESFMSQTDEAISQYEKTTGKKWGDLSAEEQTLLFSQKYHHGNLYAVAPDVAAYEPDKVLKELGPKTKMVNGKLKTVKKAEREYDSMKSFYEQEAAAGTPNAKAYALRQAARAAANVKAKAAAVASDSLKVGH